MRRPVKLPGPTPTTIPSSCESRTPPRRRSASTSSSSGDRRATDCSPEHLAVPHERARRDVGGGVEGEQRASEKRDPAGTSRLDRNHRSGRVGVRSRTGRAHRAELAAGGLGPLDERDRVRRSTARGRPTPRPRRRRSGTGRGARRRRGRGSGVPIVNVGLVTGPSTPSARHAPRTNVVLPEPSSPETVTTSPGSSRPRARRPAARSPPATRSRPPRPQANARLSLQSSFRTDHALTGRDGRVRG